MVNELDRDWPTYDRTEVTEGLVRHAGVLAERYALRGYDAIQLASALSLEEAGGNVEFMSFDVHLNQAASREGLAVAKT